MAYGNINVDTVTTSTTGGILGAGDASIMKNRLINSAMVIDQRNAGASVTPASNPTYTLDRWVFTYSQNSKFSVQQNAGSVTPPVGFTNYIGFTSLAATSLGATDYFILRQKIEGYNTADLGFGSASAKTVTLSFWVYSSLTGTFGGAITNSAENRCYPFSYTISSANTWEQKSITIAGDTTGTWLTTNGTGIELSIGLGVGTTYSGTAGAWTGSTNVSVTGAVNVAGTNGATFYITGVQLEVGSSATGFEYVNYQTSLANCQRYFEKSWDVETAVGTNTTTGVVGTGGLQSITTTTEASHYLGYKVTKRTTPTVAIYDITATANAVTRTQAGVTNNAGLYGGLSQTGASGCIPYSGGNTTCSGIKFHFTASAEL